MEDNVPLAKWEEPKKVSVNVNTYSAEDIG